MSESDRRGILINGKLFLLEVFTMDEPDLRAEKKADLGRSSGELIQDHLGRCHKSVQPLPPH